MTIFRASSTISLFLFLTALVGGVQGCQKTATVPEKYFDTLVFEVVASGSRAAITDTTEAVFTESGPWNDFLRQVTPIGRSEQPDFDQMMVAAVLIPANSGGYRVSFDSVDLIDGEIVISYTFFTPGIDCLAITAMTQPFQAIKFPRTEGSVRFVRHTRRESCNA